MCGIVGGWWIDPVDNLESKIKKALVQLKNRGPNDSGFILNKNKNNSVALGHTRLSIIDLSTGGHQPMISSDKRYSMIFNGEIYNYLELKLELIELGASFFTESDSEVLLKSWEFWGEECLIKLDGMFAFVIYDNVEQSFFCARDAFGVKPFYYEIDDNSFIFSSVLPSVLALRNKTNKPDLQRAYDYLVFSDYDSNRDTFIENVKQLRPAESLYIKIGKPNTLEIKTWWNPENIKEQKISFQSAVLKVKNQFFKNIKLQLRSDVSLGVALSGGIDSSAVVCCIRELLPESKIHTFSYLSEKEELSEKKWVDIVNKHVNAVSHEVSPSGDSLSADLMKMVHAQGEPFGSTSIYAQYSVFKLAAEAGITVTLDGQGADELLAGYNGYPGQRLQSMIEKRKYIEAFFFMKNWIKWPNRSWKVGIMSYLGVILSKRAYDFFRRFTLKSAFPAWLNNSYLENNGVQLTENRLLSNSKNIGSRVTEHLKYSLNKRSLPSLLRHADRNAMNFSIESRVPFLSIELAELLLSLPEEYLISQKGETKSIFREAMRGVVPDEILDRKDKIGFATPEKEWLLQMESFLRESLSLSLNISFINTVELKTEFNQIMSGQKKFSWQVWRWVNYCIWHDLYINKTNQSD